MTLCKRVGAEERQTERERKEQGMDLSKRLYGKTSIKIKDKCCSLFLFSISDFFLIYLPFPTLMIKKKISTGKDSPHRQTAQTD